MDSNGSIESVHINGVSVPLGGGGVLPSMGFMGTCGQPGYVFRDFRLRQGIDFIIFCLNQGIDFINFCPKQGIFSWTITACTYVLRTKLRDPF